MDPTPGHCKRNGAAIGNPLASPFERFRGAIWGQFVGDAFCLGSHWIYDLAELTRTFPQLAGFEAPRKGHYHFGKVPGDQTHYGDAALVLLSSLAELGRFDAADFGGRFMRVMGSPDYQGYIDHATRGTLANFRRFREHNPEGLFDFQQGADDDQAATATRLAPLVVCHCQDKRLLEVAASATRVSQDNGRAVAYMKCHALILQGLFRGRDLVDTLRGAGEEIASEPSYGAEIQQGITAALEAVPLSVAEVTLRFGQSCPLRHSFPAAIHAAVKHRDDFAAAVLATARAGGDNAARASLVGAWLGAFLGIPAVPGEWYRRLNAYTVIEKDVALLLRHL